MSEVKTDEKPRSLMDVLKEKMRQAREEAEIAKEEAEAVMRQLEEENKKRREKEEAQKRRNDRNCIKKRDKDEEFQVWRGKRRMHNKKIQTVTVCDKETQTVTFYTQV